MSDTDESPKDTIASRVSDLPENTWQRIRKGFRAVLLLDATKRDAYIASAMRTLADRSLRQKPELIKDAGLSEDDSNSLLFAVSIVFACLTDVSGTAEDFLQAADGKLFDEGGRAGAAIIANYMVVHRAQLQKSFSESSLAASILPSLQDFDLEIDVRVRFKDGKLEKSVPVAVVHISTDCEGEDLWFQVNKNEVPMLIEKLNKALEDMSLAEKLIETSEAEGGR